MAALRRQVGARTTTHDLDAAELVVAELLGNIIAHTRGEAWVALGSSARHLLLSVGDQGPGFTDRGDLLDAAGQLCPTLPQDRLAEHGRGLYLVRSCVLDLAVVARPTGGTVVSVTLALARG